VGGSSGAGLKSGRRGLRNQTRRASNAIDTATTATEVAEGPGFAPVPLGSLNFHSFEQIFMDAF
jgi:hypothetical protein